MPSLNTSGMQSLALRQVVSNPDLSATISSNTLPFHTPISLSFVVSNNPSETNPNPGSITFEPCDLTQNPTNKQVPFLFLFPENVISNSEIDKITGVQVILSNKNAVNVDFGILTFGTENSYVCVTPQKDSFTLDPNEQMTITLQGIEAASKTIGNTGSLSFACNGLLENNTRRNWSQSFSISLVNGPNSNKSLLDYLLVGFSKIGGGENNTANLIYVSDSDSAFSSDNNLMFYMANNNPSENLVTTPGSDTPQFFISFVGSDASSESDFFSSALGTPEDLNGIDIPGPANYDPAYGWKIEKDTQGQVPLWTLTPLNQAVLGTGLSSSVMFPINNIVSHLGPGITLMYLTYTNVGGYDDGSIAFIIEKENPLPTVISFSTSKPSYSFLEEVTFNYNLIGDTNWQLQIFDQDNGKQIGSPKDFSITQSNGSINIEGSSFSWDQNYYALLTNTSRSTKIVAQTHFTVKNTSKININSINIKRGKIKSVQPSSIYMPDLFMDYILSNDDFINISWDVCSTKGYFIAFLLTGINGKKIPTTRSFDFGTSEDYTIASCQIVSKETNRCGKGFLHGMPLPSPQSSENLSPIGLLFFSEDNEDTLALKEGDTFDVEALLFYDNGLQFYEMAKATFTSAFSA